MDIPPLPTDNLYKFVALGGLAGLLLLPAYYTSQVHERNLKLVQVAGEEKLLVAKLENVKADQAELQAELVDRVSLLAPLTTKEPPPDIVIPETETKEDRTLSADQLKDLFVENERSRTKSLELRERTRELERLVIAQSIKDAEIELLDEQLGRLKWTTLLATILSSAMANFGFIMWYVKIQRHQDRILAQQSRSTDP